MVRISSFREIPGFPGYQINDSGVILGMSGKPIGGHSNGPNSPYLIVFLSRNKKRYKRYHHRLVLEAFVGPPPPGADACHINGDYVDNRLENLRWGTRLENIGDSILEHNTHFYSSKTHCVRGHQLNDFNTLKFRDGTFVEKHRECLSCSYARRTLWQRKKRGQIHSYDEDDVKRLADERYNVLCQG